MTDDQSTVNRATTTRPRVVCLLPARNAARDLPAFFASAVRVCDAIIALDDGSTDETPSLLRQEPLVSVLLTNPRRPDYRDWDDAANRNRLLAAAADLDPEWIISLDADERIDEGDAAALRRFLETDALPGCAYGVRHVPMRVDADHFLPRYQWVYRLFSYEPGQRFPDRRLHFIPVPTSIPRARWIRTTLRIQHYGSMTEERRVARFQKYREADPDRTYQAEYGHLLHNPAPADLRRWEARPPDLPVLLAAVGIEAEGGRRKADDGLALAEPPDEDAASPPSAVRLPPTLSAIVIAQNDEATIARTVASVVEQDCPEPVEVIVVTSGTDRTAAIVREQFPAVTVVELPRPALPGEARNAGLRVTRGAYVSFPGSHIELTPGSLAARLRAHQRGYAMVTGVALNGTRTRAGWASYFLDHAEGLPGHRPAELQGPPAHCSYARLPLLEVGGFPEGVRTGEDTAVNRALVQRGYVALRDPAITFIHRSPCRTFGLLVRHHFRRGQGWGRLLLATYRQRGRLLNRQVIASRLVRHLPQRLGRIRDNVAIAEPAYGPAYRRSRPLIILGAASAWLGMWFEVLRPSPGKATILWGQPVRLLLISETGADRPSISLMRLDLVAGEARMVMLPGALGLSRPDGTRQRLDEALGSACDGRIAELVERAIGTPIDGYLVGSGKALAEAAPTLVRRPHADSSPPRSALVGLRDSGPAALRLLARGLPNDLHTSFTRWGLAMLVARFPRPRAYHIDETLLGPGDAAAPADLATYAVAIRERLERPTSAIADHGKPGGSGSGWLP